MKSRNIAYWVASVLVTIVFGTSGLLAAMHAAPMMAGLRHLGYPDYFVNILAAGKIVGLIVLLGPKMPRLKEWAYAGFSITILSGCYSHLSSGDGWLAAEPFVTFAALMISYIYRPANRRLLNVPATIA